MPQKKNGGKGRPPADGFVVRYFDRRTGRWMDARDYGYRAWPFGPKKHKG
jgi:hypothetical protein